jgi:hypothetical protein
VRWNQSLLIARVSQPRNPLKKVKILCLVRFQGDLVEEVLRIPAKSSFKRIILETPLWLCSMSLSLKSPLEGLRASECKKGKSGVRLPISNGPPTDLIKKQEGKQIKVKMPDGTNFCMAAFTSGTNEDYLTHVIAVLQIIEKKGMGAEIKAAWLAIHDVRKEMAPYFQFLFDESKEAKKLCLDLLNKFKEIVKAKKVTAIVETQKAYKMFRLFIFCNQQTQWDKIVHKMHTKDPWIGVNGFSYKGIHICSWPTFLDCIELHKLTIFPAETAEKQRYYMVQTVKKPQ